MKKQRILALTLAATTAMSMFAGMSVSAAPVAVSRSSDAYVQNQYDPETNATYTYWWDLVKGAKSINNDSYEDVVAADTFESNVVYLCDFRPETQTTDNGAKVTVDDVIAAVETVNGYAQADRASAGWNDAAVLDGDSNAVKLEKELTYAAKVLAKYYTNNNAAQTAAVALDNNNGYYTATQNRKDALAAIKAQNDAAAAFTPNFYDAFDLWNYNIANVSQTPNTAGDAWEYNYVNATTPGTLLKDVQDMYNAGSPANTVRNTKLAWLANRADTILGLVSEVSDWQSEYEQLLEKVEALNPDDYEPRKYREITDAIEDAEVEAAKGTNAGFKKAYDILNAKYQHVETKAVKYTELTNALKGLFTDGNIRSGLYKGDDSVKYQGESVYVYQKADYKADAWNEFAGYDAKNSNEDTIEGAYRAAYAVYNRCRLASTRKFVGQSEVDNAIEALDAAILALDPSYDTPSWVIVMLEEVLEKAEAVDENDYRTNTAAYKTFTAKKTAVEKMLDAGSVRTAAAQKAVSELEAAIKGLSSVKQTVPTKTRNEFRALVKEANTLLKDTTNKSLKQVNDLTAAKNADVSSATISGYAAAIDALETAIANYNQIQGKYTDTDGKTYYGQGSEKVTGWVQEGRNWYYFDPAQGGAMVANNWAQVDGKWYYLYADGIMAASAWHQVGGKWYRFNGSGAMITGWFKSSTNDNWYYLQSSGAMVADGWYWINGKCYYFYANGAMAANTTIGGWKVGADGAWIQ